MRRKPGVLVPFEIIVLDTIGRLCLAGFEEVYGLQIAMEVGLESADRGTLYRALRRLGGLFWSVRTSQ